MAIYDDYVMYTQKYQSEYGKNTIVFIMIGGFYEMYDANEGLVDIKYISELLQIQLSRKNKEILEVSRSNLAMCGFPLYVLPKFCKILIENNFTVVIVDQVTPPPNPRREVVEIISAGTCIDNIDGKDTNNLMVIYIEQNRHHKKNVTLTAVGVSIIDLSTGVNKTFESSSSANDMTLALDECYRLLTMYTPSEVVIMSGDINIRYSDVVKYLELENIYVHNKIGSMNPIITVLHYQRQVLEKVFPHSGLLSVIEYLDLEQYPTALISYIAMLQFTMAHNENVLTKISKPEVIQTNRRCIISYNTIKQLNIISEGASLLSILNTCPTAIGRRTFKTRLANPIMDQCILERRYQLIEEMLIGKRYKDIHAVLGDVYDIERLYRKMNIGKFQPADFSQIDSTCRSVCKLLRINPIEISGLSAEEVETFIDMYMNTLKIDIISKYHTDNITTSFFAPGVFEDIDILQNSIVMNISIFENICTLLNDGTNDNFFKLENNERENYHITVTKKRYIDNESVIKTMSLGDIAFNDFKTRPVSPSSSVLKITHERFKGINEIIIRSRLILKQRVTEEFQRFIARCVDEYGSLFEKLINFIGEIDVTATCAKNAHNFRYSKPAIANMEKAFVDAKAIRHPIIERINDSEYVPNDFTLGKGRDGVLLYGCNSCGKSTFMKSIGMNVILAQAGMYVAADSFVYSPYKYIFSRIPSGDNIFKAQSTFTLEIGELRNILKRADKDSLVIGDELASGTESVSAISIVSAGIIQLIQKRASFVFATHLHDVANIERVKSIPNLSIMHLSIRYDEIRRIFVYDRKLKEGQGDTIYGLEVCRGLDLDPEFMTLANAIRQDLLDINPDIVATKKSRYNAHHFIDICAICQKKAVEVHHIKEQMRADNDGFIGHIHKNKKSNLMSVCAQCHDRVHNGEIDIQGYIDTIDGRILEYQYT